MWAVYAPLLRNQRFLLLTVGQVMSQLGNFFGYIAVMALLYQMTGSSLIVGTYMGAQALGGLLFGPIAGSLADRYDLRRTMIISDLIRGVLVLMLLFATEAWHVVLIAAGKAAAAAFFTPAKTAVLPRVLGQEQLPAGLALEQTLQGLIQILGPALGGLAIGLVGLRGAFVIDAGSFAISAVSLLLLRLDTARSLTDRAVTAGVRWLSWLHGYKEVLANGLFARLMVMRLFALVGVWAINVVLVAFAYDVLRVGNVGYGILTSSLGAGTILGSLSSAYLARRAGPFTLMAGSATLIATALTAAGFTALPVAAYTFFVNAGLGIGVYNVSTAVLLQRSVPGDFLGRAAAGMHVVDQLVSLVALAAGGLLADLLGVRFVLIIGAVLIGVSGLVGLIKRRPTPSPEAAAPPATAGPAPSLVKVRRIDQTVHGGSSHRGGTAANATDQDQGENSIVIGYDGNG